MPFVKSNLQTGKKRTDIAFMSAIPLAYFSLAISILQISNVYHLYDATGNMKNYLTKFIMNMKFNTFKGSINLMDIITRSDMFLMVL